MSTTTAHHCPRCPGTALVDHTVDGVAVAESCPSCDGLWCDVDELGALLGSVPDPGFLPFREGDSDPGGPPYPHCRDVPLSPRSTLTAEPVEILDCVRCYGLWLDDGILPRLRSELLTSQQVQRSAPSKPKFYPSGGAGGEIVMATLVLVGFYYRTPEDFGRWQYWRGALLVPMAAVLLAQTAQWHEMRGSPILLEVRSTISHTGGPSDVAVLFRNGWTTDAVISSYLGLARLGLLVLAVHYVVFGVQSWRRRNEAAPTRSRRSRRGCAP